MNAPTRLLSVVVTLAILGAVVYTLRSRLAGSPVLGRWVRSSAPDRAAVAPRDSVQYWTCPMHRDVRADRPGTCPKCGMDLLPVRASDAEAGAHRAEPAGGSKPNAEGTASPGAASVAAPGGQGASAAGQQAVAERGAGVTIDPRRQQLIGVRTVRVERTSLTRKIRTVGLVRYDETRLADVNLKTEGWIRDLYVDYTGQFVRKGQPLFTLYSPELLTTQNEYLLALASREQLKQSQLADAREHADRLVDSARQRLALWDLSPDQIKALEETRQPQTAVTFGSPVSGFVIEKQAVKGKHVASGENLYRIADLSVVWVEADVYEQDIPLVRTGARAAVTLDAYPGERVNGRAAYVYPFVEEKTRTVRVRFEFANPRGHLKPGMYASVELTAGLGSGLTVPSNALLDSGAQQIVFVAQGGGYFGPRPVKVGQRFDNAVQILEGLKEGEEVATGAAFFLDSESQLRAALQGFESPPPSEIGPPGTGKPLDITFRSQPDPPKGGDNLFEVAVKDAGGKPITDAEVSVVFYMAAMPTMNMPAMRSEVKLPPAGGGLYRGRGSVLTAGRWSVSIIVTRAGQRLGMAQLTVVTR